MSSAAKTAAPAATESKKGRKAASAAAPAAPAPVAAPAPAPVAAPAPAAPAAAPAAEESLNVVAKFNSLVEKMNGLRSALGVLLSEAKVLEKQIPREMKKAQKGRRRKATTEGGEEKPKKETVFNKPTAISDALCTFLGVAKGTLMSRSDVTRKLCAYAKSKNLMEKQVIKADAPLRKLLALKESDELKILNLQKYLKPHYPKAASA